MRKYFGNFTKQMLRLFFREFTKISDNLPERKGKKIFATYNELLNLSRFFSVYCC